MIMRNNILTRSKGIQFLLVIAIALLFSQCEQPASLSALIVSDSGEEVNKDLKTILENTGLFDADVSKSKSPGFSDFDVVVLNIEKADWTEKTKASFVTYVNGGGGVVILGASAFAFGDWPALSEIVGYSVGGNLQKSTSPFEYPVVFTNKKHPVTDGLPSNWRHTEDYLLFNTASIKGEIEVLGTARADTLQGGDGTHLPVMISAMSGEGRVFQSTLGFASADDASSPLQCVGFITTLQRGAEWAATGVVSQEVPIDFPSSVSTHKWEDFKPLTLEDILKRSATYKVGKSKKYLSDFSMRIRNCDGKPDTYAMYESKILKFLASEATVDSKNYMCKELSWIGSEKSVSVLEKLVNDKELSDAANYALQRLRM